MRKYLVAISIIVSLVLTGGFLAACGGATPTTPATTQPGTTVPPTSTFKMPSTIRIVAGGTGGTQYILGTALAPTLEKYLQTAVRVQPLEVIRERFMFFREGKADLGVVSFSNMRLSMEGQEAFAGENDGPQEMRMVWYIFDAPTAYIVRGDSDIKALTDIKGKRVAWPIFSPSMQAAVYALLEIAGLTEKDVVLVPFSDIAALYRSVGEGKSDITYALMTSSATFETEAMPHGLRVLPIRHNTKDMEIFVKWSPISLQRVLGYEGISSSKGVEGAATPYGISAHSNVSEELVYQVTKVMWEKFEEYKNAQNYLKYGTHEAQKELVDCTPMPYHPGAIRLFKEVGIWTAENDKWNDELLAKEEQYKHLWDATVAKAKAQNIKVETTNKEWMALWDKERAALPLFKVKL